MRGFLAALLAAAIAAGGATAGEKEIRAAQGTIEAQLQALLADDGALAYSYAAPGLKRVFPDVDSFMNMVETGYMPVRRPGHYSFGKARETSAGSMQQVMIVGPDGKDYEAVYKLELQPDGVFRITGVSLRATASLST